MHITVLYFSYCWLFIYGMKLSSFPYLSSFFHFNLFFPLFLLILKVAHAQFWLFFQYSQGEQYSLFLVPAPPAISERIHNIQFRHR